MFADYMEYGSLRKGRRRLLQLPSPSSNGDPLILHLPEELVREIFSYLDRDDLKHLAMGLPELADFANDRLMLRRLCLSPEDVDCRTLHQAIGGYENVSQLTIMDGLRFTKTTCQRISKDLKKLTRLCLHLNPSSKLMDQELLNVTTHVPQLTSLEVNLSVPAFTVDGLLTALSQLRQLERFHLTCDRDFDFDWSKWASRRNLRDNDRTDLTQLLTRIASQRNAVLKDVSIDLRSARGVRRCTPEGFISLTPHCHTLTSLNLKFTDFDPGRFRDGSQSRSIIALRQLSHLKKFGLTCVEGFRIENWIELFFLKSTLDSVNANRNRAPIHDHDSAQAAFPKLEELDLDFLSDLFLWELARVYGGFLKRLGLYDYRPVFDTGGEIEWNHQGNTSCPKEFSQILRSFSALSKISLGFQKWSLDVHAKRVLRWFVHNELDAMTIPYSIELQKL